MSNIWNNVFLTFEQLLIKAVPLTGQQREALFSFVDPLAPNKVWIYTATFFFVETPM